MAEILINSQSPIVHQIFWNGDIAVADALPVVKIYDVTLDATISPAVLATTVLATITSTLDDNNPGTYFINVPYALANRNKTLKLKWEYSVGSVAIVRSDEVSVITPYVDFNYVQDLGYSTDSSDPGYKSYKELIAAEKYARKQIEQYTRQKFYLYDNTLIAYGQGYDILPLPAKINKLHSLYIQDRLLVDNINNINNWNFPVQISESGYGIRINKAGMLDNTVYTANGMVPPSIHDYSGIFHPGIQYKVFARFGWDNVPENVELATVELMRDYFSKDSIWRKKYIKAISTFDWNFEYSGDAYSGTGNAVADNLLADYVLTAKAEII